MYSNVRASFLFIICYTIIRYSHALTLDGITISIKEYNGLLKTEQSFAELVILDKNSTTTIDVVDIPSVVSFLVIQVHTYQYNITLSYDNTFTFRKYTFGTNLGLVFEIIYGENKARAYVKNDNLFKVETLLAVVAYNITAPIPGGCNMEFDTQIAPYQRLTVSESMVKVDIQPASVPKLTNIEIPCEANAVEHEVYRIYLAEQDFNVDNYFTAIKNSLTVQGILENGRKIPPPATGSKMRRVYSAYPGTGSLYAAVAIFGNSTAAYVPTFTYACSPLQTEDTCQVLTSTFSKILCAVIFFLGLFVTFLGHKYFKTEMFLLGFLSGGLISYIVIAVIGNYGPSGNIGISVFLGFLLGLAWLGVWWFYAIPVLSILLATLTLGFFCSSIAYFSSPAGILYFENDTNFWLIFSVIVMCVPLIFSVVPYSANIISCAILGSYAVISSIDHYAGSNLKYIIINTMRRATSSGFNLAVIYPPYQFKDILLTCCWIILAIAGTFIQLKQNRGKPPFPPRMSNSLVNYILATERTPLLTDPRISAIILQNENSGIELPRRKWYDRFFKTFRLNETRRNT